MSVVKKLFRDVELFNVDLENWEILDKGITALWGPSGAGKSTIVNVLLGLDDLATLDWRWGEESIHQLPPPDRNLGAVFQDPGLFPHMSVKENILFPINKKQHLNWETDYHFLVSQLQLEEISSSPCGQISGGEAQRVALARALIYRPRLVILDEPFSSLDLALRHQSREMLLKLTQELSCPLLLISHDPEDIEVLANKITYLERGKITREEQL